MSTPKFIWTQERIDWLRMALEEPEAGGKPPSHERLAARASERYGVSVSRNIIRHAISEFVAPRRSASPDGAEKVPPDVALVLARASTLDRELERERDKSAIIVEAIRQTVASLPLLEPFPAPAERLDEDPHVAMVDISDVHVGESVDPALTGGLNAYSFDVFKARGERFRSGFHRLIGLRRKSYPIDILYVNFLGDVVTGEAIYGGQAFQIDMPLLMQVFESGYWFANLLRDFSRSFSAVHVRCVAGNHGRGGEKGKSHPRTNWDTAVYMLLRTLLKDHGNIDFEVSESSFLAYHIPGHEAFVHALIHGDQARSYLNIPFYGMERAGMKMSTMLNTTIDYLHAGHHHNEAGWPLNRTEFFMNGSWVGGSDLSVNKLFRASRPTQNLFVCHPKRGVVSNERIQLDSWMELHPDSQGVYRPA